MMQLCVVLLAIVAVVQAEGWTRKSQNDIRDAHTECIAQNPVSKENIAEMKNFVYPDEESVRKYIQCIGEKLEVFCTHEGFHGDRIVEQFKGNLPKAEVKTIVDNCIDKNEQGSPVDVWAYRVHKCFVASKLGELSREYLRKTFAA